MFESYSNYKLDLRSVVKRTSLQPICSFKLINEMTLRLICECGLYAGVYGTCVRNAK